jgi:hypothetical protein
MAATIDAGRSTGNEDRMTELMNVRLGANCRLAVFALTAGTALFAGCSADSKKSGTADEHCCRDCDVKPAAKLATTQECCPDCEVKPAGTAATKPSGPATNSTAGGEWKSLFDGATLKGWKSADFGGQGEPAVENGAMVLPAGVGLTGIVYTGDVPKMNYEVSIEAKRIDGADFFCGLTFPVADTHASLIIGGWGGSLCGISSLDGNDAAHNETGTNRRLESGRWYAIRLQVLPDRLVAFIDDEKIIDVVTRGKEISLRQDIDQSKPFGLSAWQTSAAIKSVKIRKLDK